MKNIINNKTFRLAILSLMVVVVTGSCKKFLEVKPVSEFDNTAVFSDVPNATLAVMGAYAPLSGNNTYGQHLSQYYPYDSDEGGVTGDNSEVDRRGIGRYNLSSGNSHLFNPWRDLYQAIERANICIEQIPLMKQYSSGSASEQLELKRLHGEVLTIRAQCLFELIRNWGDVPAPMIPAYKQTDLSYPKQNRDETYEMLIADLATASTLVPWKNAVTRNERITKAAVKGLRARLALFRAGYASRNGVMLQGSNSAQYYQIAKDECADIIASGQHILNPDFKALWRDNLCAHKFDQDGEIIFEIAMAGASAADDSQLGYYIGISSTQLSNVGQCNAGVLATPTYFMAFVDSFDTRRDVTIGNYSIGSTNIKSASKLGDLRLGGKFRREWCVGATPGPGIIQYIGYNWPVIRYSDILLMYAEADNELNNGPSALAIQYFEQVRKRGFLGNETKIGVTPTDKVGFFDAIVNERLLEFGGEGIRKYDLIRWNLLGAKLAQNRIDMQDLKAGTGKFAGYPTVVFWANNGNEIEWKTSFTQTEDSASYIPPLGVTPTGWKKLDWRVGIVNLAGSPSTQGGCIECYGRYYTPGKSELMPIPNGVIISSPGLEQNSGY